MKIPDSQRKAITDILTADFMSSEEEDEDGNKVFVRRPKDWRSDQVMKCYRKLDNYFVTNIQKKRGRDQTVKRTEGPASTRNKPSDIPVWSVRSDTQALCEF